MLDASELWAPLKSHQLKALFETADFVNGESRVSKRARSP